MDLPEGPRIIALCGPKTCGKDTAAAGLLKQNLQVKGKYHPFFLKTPFAFGVKSICHNTFGWTFDEMDDPTFKETPLLEWPCIEPRWAMMDIANFMRDKYGVDVWVHALSRHLAQVEKNDPHGAYVITDLRFPNELEWLKKRRALIIYVERTESEIALSRAVAAGDPRALNPSEAHYTLLKQEADHVLENNGTTYNLQHELMMLVRSRFEHWNYWGMGPLTKESN